MRNHPDERRERPLKAARRCHVPLESSNGAALRAVSLAWPSFLALAPWLAPMAGRNSSPPQRVQPVNFK